MGNDSNRKLAEHAPFGAQGFYGICPDSIGRFYDYNDGACTGEFLYWVTDSILTEAYPRVGDDTIKIRYRYYIDRDWVNGDRMRLDFIAFSVQFNTLELRRIH
jgi:hypothetical protein